MSAGKGALMLALCMPLGAHPADWVRVGAPDQHQHSYDRSKLVIEGDEITYWRRVLFRAPQPAKSGVARLAMYRERIDCRLHTHRTLGYLLYAQDGSIIDNVYTPQGPAEPIIPETVGDRFETLMCVFVEQAQASSADAELRPAAEAAAPQDLRTEVEQLSTRLRALEERLQRIESASPSAPSQATKP